MRTDYPTHLQNSLQSYYSLGLTHLISTPALKPYMHGYFLSLKLYTTARLIANPQSYSEYRDRIVNEKLKARSESRIRARKDQPKVNKALAERVRRAEEREKALERKKKERRGLAEAEGEEMEEDEEGGAAPGLLQDPRFKELWENPEFEVDEESREFALLNPATANNNVSPFLTIRVSYDELIPIWDRPSGKQLLRRRKMKVTGCLLILKKNRRVKKSLSSSKTKEARVTKVTMAVSYLLLIVVLYLDANSNISYPDLLQYDPRQLAPSQRRPMPRGKPTLVVGGSQPTSLPTFGQRLHSQPKSASSKISAEQDPSILATRRAADGGMEMSFIPSSKPRSGGRGGGSDGEDDQDEYSGGTRRRDRVERFGAGMEKGHLEDDELEGRGGRMQRRRPGRSASKNAFRRK